MAESTDIGVHLILSADLIGDATPESFSESVTGLINAAPVASAEFVPPKSPGNTLTADIWWRPFLRALTPAIQGCGTAFLLRMPNLDPAWFETCRAAEMDGVMVTKSTEVRKARDAVGANAIVGALTGPIDGPNASARHDAMVAAESGADVVVFTVGIIAGDDASIVSYDESNAESGWSVVQWWAEMMEVPCISVIPPTPQATRRARSSGADFVGLDQRLWTPSAPWSAASDHLSTLKAILSSDR